VKLSRMNLVLAVAMGAVILIAVFVRVDHSRPNVEIHLGDDMAYSPAYGAYAENSIFIDGRTSQAPVPGTIARGALSIRFEATPEGALRAGQQLKSPYDPKSDEGRAAVQRGAQAYKVFCTACHGGGGAGDGPVARRGFPPPPSLLTGKSVQMKDGQLFHILTYGQGSMSPFAGQLSPGRRWDLISYVRSIQQQATASSGANAQEPIPGKQEGETKAKAAANQKQVPPRDTTPAAEETKSQP
jgi:mono/diheme cytochrome c family protein